MKKLCILLCLLLPMLLVTACRNGDKNPDEEAKEGITINVGNSLTMGVTETKQLQAINSKTKTPMTNVVWASDNESVAFVDYSGVVTGIADGEATITASTIDGKYKATCKVTVSSVLTGITFETATVELEKGSKTTLNLKLTPENITGVNITWMTGDPSVATVDNGVVTAVGNGSTSIIASADEGKHTAVCTVNVVTTVTGITMDEHMLMMSKGDSKQLTVTVAPEGASDPELTWTSSNTSVASVTDSGVVVALSGGSTIITATSANGKTDTCNIVVTSPVTGVTLDREEITIAVNQVDQLVATILPADANTRDMVWNSSDLSVVTVDLNGALMGLKAGTAEITVTTVDGYFTATCVVTVQNTVTEIVFDAEGGDLELGKTQLLVPIFNPVDCDPPVLTWTSSDPTVATVAEDGTVTALKLGETVITVTAENGVFAEYKLRVVELEVLIDRIVVDATMTVKVAKPFNLNISILPANATESYTVTVAHPSVVRLNTDGSLVPLKAGVTVVTVTSKSGAVSASCVVNVEALTDSERVKFQQEYDTKLDTLAKENETNLENITKKYDEQIASIQEMIKKLSVSSKDDYEAKRNDLQTRLSSAKSDLDEVTAEGNQQLIDVYTNLCGEIQVQIDTLEADWSIYNLLNKNMADQQTAKANELQNENTRYANAQKELKAEYAFLF